jgi:hypothetical protein
MQMPRPILSVVVAVVLATTSSGAVAQDLEPRAYSPAPIGTTFVVAGFGRSQGPILVDLGTEDS